MRDVLDLGGSAARGGCLLTPSSHGAKLVSADYHGAEVEVVRSRSSGGGGVEGDCGERYEVYVCDCYGEG